ncbi:MAG: hypothetical protein Q9225_004460 [Loekoesia sp. 1 TL-2023]
MITLHIFDADVCGRDCAFPVYRVRKELFFVPATRRDYRTLRKIQDRTDARRARITFNKAGAIPGRTLRIPVIQVKMPNIPHECLAQSGPAIYNSLQAMNWKYLSNPIMFEVHGAADKKSQVQMLPGGEKKFQQPDSSLVFPGATFPFFVLEVANTQSHQELRDKAHYWVQGSREHMKFLCLLQVIHPKGQPGHRITATIIKPYRDPRPTPENPHNCRIEPEYVFDQKEVYPERPTGKSFRIFLKDTLPKNAKADPTIANEFIDISLDVFHLQSLQALPYLKATSGTGSNTGSQSSSLNTNQERVTTPPSSLHDWEEWEPESPEPDDSEGENPTFTITRRAGLGTGVKRLL